MRKHPAVVLGSDGVEGCQHCVNEIILNAVHEAREGYGNRIVFTKFLDGSFEVKTSDVVFRIGKFLLVQANIIVHIPVVTVANTP